jgi:hypothetical protein
MAVNYHDNMFYNIGPSPQHYITFSFFVSNEPNKVDHLPLGSLSSIVSYLQAGIGTYLKVLH